MPAKKEVYIEKKGEIHSTVRKLGKDVKDTSKKEDIKRFVSLRRDHMIFKDEGYYIKFDNHIFETDNKSDINFLLREDSGYKKDYWLNEYPPEVIAKKKEDAKWIETSEDMFEPFG